MRSMADRLAEILDRLDIMELGARYNKAALAWDAEAFAGCFTLNGRLVRAHVKSETTGREALKQLMRSGAESGLPASHHLTMDFIIELDGDRATSTCQLLLYGVDPESGGAGPNVIRGVGHFADKLMRTPDGWRFEERIGWVTAPDMRPVPIGQASHHSNVAPAL